MQRWRPVRICYPVFRPTLRRWFSSHAQDHVHSVRVRCASSGSISVNLHNISFQESCRPLVIYLPPFSHADNISPPPLPAFLQSHATAVINYRWLNPSHNGSVTSSSQWPYPIHDTMFGYSWIMENLAPPGGGRRDVYVYGSYLGASLAAGLALSESFPHQRMAVRGVMAYNGIYNWTMFLPDHPMHRNKSFADTVDHLSNTEDGSYFSYLKATMPTLFSSPGHLFDPFASPSLFFHNPGLLVPNDFDSSALPDAMKAAINALSKSSSLSEEEEDDALAVLKAPRKSYLGFPPTHSTLKIPETLLMYEPPPPCACQPWQANRGGRPEEKKPRLNNFETQATELARLMRRSIDKMELRQRRIWDYDFEDSDGEALRRVEVQNVGSVEVDGELGQQEQQGQELAAAWLEDRIGK